MCIFLQLSFAVWLIVSFGLGCTAFWLTSGVGESLKLRDWLYGLIENAVDHFTTFVLCCNYKVR